jgi:hypothetical protein
MRYAPRMLRELGLVVAVALARLPPPPDRVERPTPMYGTVIVDHRLHLVARATCKACHGPGVVGKIPPMNPADAHATCRGCHVERAQGPTTCRGCHLQTVPREEIAAGESEASRPAWGDLRWCMTTAEARDAVARMKPLRGATLEFFQNVPGPSRIQRYRVALEHPIAGGGSARIAYLEFRDDRLRAIRLAVKKERKSERQFGRLVAAYTASLGEPLPIVEGVSAATWRTAGTETTLIGSTSGTAPIELWLTPTSDRTCGPGAGGAASPPTVQ